MENRLLKQAKDEVEEELMAQLNEIGVYEENIKKIKSLNEKQIKKIFKEFEEKVKAYNLQQEEVLGENEYLKGVIDD